MQQTGLALFRWPYATQKLGAVFPLPAEMAVWGGATASEPQTHARQSDASGQVNHLCSYLLWNKQTILQGCQRGAGECLLKLDPRLRLLVVC